ncbi:MAG: hypothetical protein EA363_11510 [Balneolaceae bacterium]|nr:MAG: hypothetical protein EA363_11510 [Balneolaceae bacterium]
MSRLTAWKQRWQAINADPRARKLQKLLQRVVVLAIVGLIIYQLTDIGWGEVLQSLPASPWFYVLFGVLFVSLPVAEIFIYRRLWRFDAWQGFRAFLTKWVYNHEVVGYSGEFYLFLWARKRVGLGDRQIFRHIRDNSIISSVNSNLVAITLLAALLYTGQLDLTHVLDDTAPIYIGAGILLLAVVTALVVQFRKYIFDMPLRTAAAIFGIYLTRFLLHHAGLVLMWMAAIPGTPLPVWLTFLAMLIVINRIPFLPSKDLVFMWAGLEYARGLDVTIAAVAGMLLVYSALHKVVNLGLFLALQYWFRDPEIEEAKSAPVGAEQSDEPQAD